MDEDKLKTIVEEVINKAVEPINRRLGSIEERLDDPDTGLAAINSRLDANTGAVIELEKTVKGYADMYIPIVFENAKKMFDWTVTNVKLFVN